jgi:hypothetical protein
VALPAGPPGAKKTRLDFVTPTGRLVRTAAGAGQRRAIGTLNAFDRAPRQPD